MRKRIAKLGKRNIILVPRWLLPSLLILIVLKMLMIFRSGDSGLFIFHKRPWGLCCCFCGCYSPGWDHRGADEMAQERLDSHGPRVWRSIKGNVESWISSAEFWKSYRILTISFGITLGYLLLMTQLVSLASCSPGCPGTCGHGGWGLAGAHRSNGRANVTPLASLFTHGCSCRKIKFLFLSHTGAGGGRKPQTPLQLQRSWAQETRGDQMGFGTCLQQNRDYPRKRGTWPPAFITKAAVSCHSASLTAGSWAVPGSGGTAPGAPITVWGLSGTHPTLPPAPHCFRIAVIKWTSITHEMALLNDLCASAGFTHILWNLWAHVATEHSGRCSD